MNILPHKSWHVRTKANIARVRKDEAKAAEEEREKKRRIDLAEQEARIEILRKKAKLNKNSDDPDHSSIVHGTTSLVDSGHVNLFQALEEGRDAVKKPNVEHEKEKKDEQEKYEKQIGYLTYLGQDTNEALKKVDWYEEAPDREKLKNEKSEVGLKFKSLHDPLNVIKKYLPDERIELPSGSSTMRLSYEPIMSQVISINKELEIRKKLKKKEKKSKKKSGKKSKKHKSKHKKKSSKKKRDTSSSESDSNNSQGSEEDEAIEALKKQKLEILRQERLKREKEERARAEALLAKVRGDPPPKPKEPERPQIKQKYNSQFNPDLARQNYDDRYQ
uniref:CSON005942 protein n=1 Tax=Culicoides sonorensis TaxID=179676 RepID=A0A336LAX0_CULSO